MKLFTSNPENNDRVELANIDLTETLTAREIDEYDCMEWSVKVAVPKEWQALIYRIGINRLAERLDNPMITLIFTACRFFVKSPDIYIDFNDGDLKCYLDLNMKEHLTKDDLIWFYNECKGIYYHNQFELPIKKVEWGDIKEMLYDYRNYLDNSRNCYNYLDVEFSEQETKAIKKLVFEHIRSQNGYSENLEEYITNIA